MPEEKIEKAIEESKPAETVVEETPMTDEQIIADAIADRKRSISTEEPEEAEPAEEPAAETGETPDTLSEPAPEEEPGEEELPEEPEEKPIKELPDDSEEVAHIKKSMQKRIDRLTAEKKALEEKVARETPKSEPTEDKKEPIYTKEQLRAATRKFMDDGDAEGLFEVMEQMTKQETKKLREEYIQEQTKKQDAIKANQKEWQSVTMHYSNDEDPQLDIRRTESLLYKIAKQFYEDPEIGPSYLLPGGGGMLQAAADALAEILKFRADKTVKDKKVFVKNKEVKERRKTALGGIGSMKPDTTQPKSGKSELDEYIAERKAALAKKKGYRIEE